MTQPISTERRSFLFKSAALTGGLTLGVQLPLSAGAAEAGAKTPPPRMPLSPRAPPSGQGSRGFGGTTCALQFVSTRC